MKKGIKKNKILLPILLMVAVGIGALLVFRSYNTYLDELIHQERLNQMGEVTNELYSSMDLLMSNEWSTAQFIRDGVNREHPETVEQLTAYLQRLQNIYQTGANELTPIAIDGSGRYYSASGKKGVIYNIEELIDCEERISSVTNIFGTDATDILFLYKLEEPISMENNTILYCGYIKDFSIIIDRYHTDAFSGQSIVYVMNGSGTKLYSTDSENQVFVGRNIYSILEDMTYTHGNSYASCMQVLEETGNSIANASLNGTEYYLCLHRMADTDWVLLLAIPAQYVATNTQILVNSVVKTLLFAGVALVVIFVILLVIFMRMQQQEQLYRQEQENSEKLEVSRREAEEAFLVAEAANKAKSTFLNNMSHDIRTPMNAIIGFTNIAMKHSPPPEIKSCLDKISDSSEHLLAFINDVLDISRIESGKIKYTPTPVDVAEVSNSVLTIMQGYLSNRNITFQTELEEPKMRYVLTDAVRVREVLVNILGNAVKFTNDGGTITYGVSYHPGKDDRHINVRYRIADTGIGMAEEFVGHIFDEFSQEDHGARTQYQGTGLGLAITKRYVDMMGGTISVESKKGVGSTFTVELPMEITDVCEVKKADYAVGKVDLTGLKVLLAEDNELNAEIAIVQLEELGMKITRAADGEEAVRFFAENPQGTFDLILMDVMMPKMNGYEATKAIRSLQNRSDADTIPIIAMTANAFAEDVQASLDSGMNGHLSKPIVMDEVIKAIARNLN